MSPQLTCIVPTHDRDGLLAVALNSIRDQQVSDLEVVVVDDLCQESTRSLVAQWGKDSSLAVRYVGLPRDGDGSAGASRNAGAAISSSPVLAFLDDDDVWAPDYLQSQLAALAQGADLAIAWTAHVRDGQREPGLRISDGLVAADVVGANPGLTGSNFVIQRSVFEAIGGFDENLVVANDLDFLIRLLDGGYRYITVPRELVMQVGHELGQLTSPTERRARGLEAYLAKYHDRLAARDRRSLRRAVHSVRRISAPGRAARFSHVIAQLWNSTPEELMVTVRNGVTGRRSIYSARSSAKGSGVN